jgi:dihydroorotate dehydrogenase
MTETKMLAALFTEIQKENNHHLPILVKLSPDSSRQLVENIVAAACQSRLSGYVCGNTSTARTGLATPPKEIERIGAGGLSGPPLRKLSLELCRLVFQIKALEQVIIGCGGITSGKDAYEFIKNGASAVQLYTGLIYEGPTLPRQINLELAQLLRRDGISLSEAIGMSLKNKKPATHALTS